MVHTTDGGPAQMAVRPSRRDAGKREISDGPAIPLPSHEAPDTAAEPAGRR